MKKYYRYFLNTIQMGFQYRLDFVVWRIRSIMGLILLYFLWISLLPQGEQLFGYSQSQILTYVFLSDFVSNLVFSAQTAIVGDEINSGELSNYLIRPFNYFGRLVAYELGNKILNLIFASIEITILFFILRPPFFFGTLGNILLSLVAIIFAAILYFILDVLLGTIGFWSPEIWAPRFILMIIIQFFSGAAFPLDILPKPIFQIFQLTPFPYLLFFPIKLYLGQLSVSEILRGFSILCIWVVILWIGLQMVWDNGLKSYSAQGR